MLSLDTRKKRQLFFGSVYLISESATGQENPVANSDGLQDRSAHVVACISGVKGLLLKLFQPRI